MQDSKSWTIGRIAGTPVNVRASALLLIVVFSALYYSQFAYYAASSSTAIAASVGLGLVLVLSVFLHEVAHVLVAKAFKVDAHEIGLTFFGGHAGFKKSFDRPWHSFLTSVAGPLTNVVLAIVLYQVSAAMSLTASNYVVYLLIHIAATMNLFLGIFNLLPGLPLDGGNAVSALVWQFTKKRATGVKVAARAGQVVCVLWLAYAVVWPLVRGQHISTFYIMWTLLIIVVLWTGARAALAQAAQLKALDSTNLSDVTSPVVLVTADQPITAAGEALVKLPVNSAIVVLDPFGAPVGYVDPRALYAVPAEVAHTVTIAAVTVPLVEGSVVSASSTVEQLLNSARTKDGIRTMYVLVDNGQVSAVVWVASLVQALNANR